MIPPAKRGGGKRTVKMREVVNGVMYVLSTGCPWRYIPKDLPPRSTVNGYFCQWGWDGTLEKMHHALLARTIDWYLAHREWWQALRAGRYAGQRLGTAA